MTFISLLFPSPLFLSPPHSIFFISPFRCVRSHMWPPFRWLLFTNTLGHVSNSLNSLMYSSTHCFLFLFLYSPTRFFICHSFLITPALCFISIQSKKMALGVICVSHQWQNGGRHQRSRRCHQPPNLRWCLPVTRSRSRGHHAYLQRVTQREGNMYL